VLSLGTRPRELRWWHAGPMLFGDWGTSRLYVLGLAWVATGASSFVYVAAMSALLLVVSWAYTIICRLWPSGGGVYAAARARAPILGVIGGLLLFADYVVTVAISSLEAFRYLGVPRPGLFAMIAIVGLGVMHFFGPKKAGVAALWIAAFAFVSYVVVAVVAAPSFPSAHVATPSDSLGGHWSEFVHIVLALSGVEAVANMTGIMVEPVGTTAKRTIWPVAIEVVLLNLGLSLAIHAAPREVVDGRRDDMIRALAEHYVGPAFASIAAIVFALLLLSAASTAITGMLGVQYAMARDGELPRRLARINRFGVPLFSLIVAVAAPLLVLSFEQDLGRLAALYAIGVVGAIALDCYASATNERAPRTVLTRPARIGLLALSVLMAGIWLTVAFQKPEAVVFAAVVLGAGLVARVAFRRYRRIAHPVIREPFPADAPRLLVASRGDTPIVDAGLARASEIAGAVVVCLVREASFLTDAGEVGPPDPDLDPEAKALFDYAVVEAQKRAIPLRTFYTVSTNPMYVIADYAVTLGVAEVHVGGSRRSRIEKALRGSPLEELRSLLPTDIAMIVHRPLQEH
jgi:amino acid transporter